MTTEMFFDIKYYAIEPYIQLQVPLFLELILSTLVRMINGRVYINGLQA